MESSWGRAVTKIPENDQIVWLFLYHYSDQKEMFRRLGIQKRNKWIMNTMMAVNNDNDDKRY